MFTFFYAQGKLKKKKEGFLLVVLIWKPYKNWQDSIKKKT
jgi:hypothetical protein